MPPKVSADCGRDGIGDMAGDMCARWATAQVRGLDTRGAHTAHGSRSKSEEDAFLDGHLQQ